MPACRSMPEWAWEEARRKLVYFFSRGRALRNAEDLAQDTLAAFWSRPDFEFASEQDFYLVCYGFARRILKASLRRESRWAGSELLPEAASSQPLNSFGLNDAEMAVFLNEVLDLGESALPAREWHLVRSGSEEDRGTLATLFNLGNANNAGVKLFRARRRLAILTGWRKK